MSEERCLIYLFVNGIAEKEITILPYREGNRVTRREINPTSLPRGLDLEHLALNLDMEQRLTSSTKEVVE